MARLVGVPPGALAGIARMMASGAATWSGHKLALPPPVCLSPGGLVVSHMVIEDRV